MQTLHQSSTNYTIRKFKMLTNQIKFICHVDISQVSTNNNEKHRSVQHIKIIVEGSITALPG